MNISFEGIGAWSATFANGGVTEGQVVKLSAAGTAAACAAGDAFCGVAGAVRGDVCGVQMGGLVQVKYSGDTVPAVGYTSLTADGLGGVCVPAAPTNTQTAENAETAAADADRYYLVVDVNTADATCVIKL